MAADGMETNEKIFAWLPCQYNISQIYLAERKKYLKQKKGGIFFNAHETRITTREWKKWAKSSDYGVVSSQYYVIKASFLTFSRDLTLPTRFDSISYARAPVSQPLF